MTSYVLHDGFGTTKPRNNRTFTTAELADALGVVTSSIIKMIHTKKLSYNIVVSDHGKRMVVPYETYAELKQYYDKKFEKMAEKRKVVINTKPAVKQNITLEEMHKLHPLVTDDRFFKESYFPEIIPDCFEDMEA
mgnify:CR=1 FL=1